MDTANSQPTEKDLKALLQIGAPEPVVVPAEMVAASVAASVVIEKPRVPSTPAPPPSGRIVAAPIRSGRLSLVPVVASALVIMIVAGVTVWAMSLRQHGADSLAALSYPPRPARTVAPGFKPPMPPDANGAAATGLLGYVIELSLPTPRQTDQLAMTLARDGYAVVPPALSTDRRPTRLIVGAYASEADADADRQQIVSAYPQTRKTSQVVRAAQ
jgi:hypothetical protein